MDHFIIILDQKHTAQITYYVSTHTAYVKLHVENFTCVIKNRARASE